VVNDNTTGTGLNQWDYSSGGWSYYNTLTPTIGALNNDEHYASVTGVIAHFRFNGTQVAVYGLKEPKDGNAAYSIDGGPEQIIDCYNPSYTLFKIYSSVVLPLGNHDLRIRVVGTKNPSSTSTYITVDHAEVFSNPGATQSPTPTVTPTPTSSPTPTSTPRSTPSPTPTTSPTASPTATRTPTPTPSPTVTPSPTPTPTPSGQFVSSFTLINADNGQAIQTLNDGATLRLSALPTRNLNIRANTTPATVGSVVLVLSGAQTKNQTENSAPYALFGDNGGKYNPWTPAIGSYTLKATPFSKPSGNGTTGTSLTINFAVSN
jgi:cell division septation protein DedD